MLNEKLLVVLVTTGERLTHAHSQHSDEHPSPAPGIHPEVDSRMVSDESGRVIDFSTVAVSSP